MARITMEKALVAAGVGAIDLAGEKYLASKKIGPLSGSDALKLGIAAASFLVNYFDYEREYSEAAFYASLPGVVKASANLAGLKTQAVQRVQAVPVVVERVSAAPSVSPAPAQPEVAP